MLRLKWRLKEAWRGCEVTEVRGETVGDIDESGGGEGRLGEVNAGDVRSREIGKGHFSEE